MAENILITICARARSKRLPNKNILPIHGKPLIVWTIKHAKKWGKANIVISSNSIKVNGRLKYWIGGKTILDWRPDKLAQDDTPKINVIRHCLKKADKHWETQFGTIIDLDVTNPLRTIYDIEGAYQAFIKGGYDSLSSVVEARKNPYYSMVETSDIGGKEYADLICEGDFITCSQQAPKVYEQNANIYVYSRDYLLDERNINDIGSNTGIYIMPDWTFCDINTELDFKLVEFLMGEYLLI